MSTNSNTHTGNSAGHGSGGNSHGRPPRAGGRGRGNNNRSNTSSKKKQLSDYIYYLGSPKQASDYETTTEYLINHIKKTFDFGNDIGTALEMLEPYNISQHMPHLSAGEQQQQMTKPKLLKTNNMKSSSKQRSIST
jgi:hypothetical protein